MIPSKLYKITSGTSYSQIKKLKYPSKGNPNRI